MENPNHLLSDKFQEFSTNINNLYNLKKDIEFELEMQRYMYNTLISELSNINNEVIKAQQEWEAWKKDRLKNTSDN